MKKILNVVLAGTVALGFAACDKNKTNAPLNEEGTTAVQFTVSEVKTRAVNQGEKDVDGITKESKIGTGKFITPTADLALTMKNGSGEGVYQSDPTEYKGATGTDIQSAFLLNLPASINANINTPDQVIGIAELKNIVSDANGITMTSATKGIEIKSGIKKDEIAEGKNKFSYNIERIVSKVQVTMPEAGLTLSDELTSIGTFGDVRYAVAGGAKKLYLFGNHAGDRVMDKDNAGDHVYNDFKSAIHDLSLTTFKTENGVMVFDKRRDLTQVSEKSLIAPFASKTDAANFADKQSLLVRKATTYDKASDANGIYFFENSFGKEITEEGQLNLADITYVKVYATMSALNDKVIKEVGEGNSYVYATAEEVAAAREEKLEVDKTFYDAHKAETEKYNFELNGTYGAPDAKYFLVIKNTANTFYKGANGKLYLSLTASRADGNKTTEKFIGGKMVWWVPANSQLDKNNKFTEYAVTRRNNIYALNIGEIQGLGHNYDPLDPEDPNSPKPDVNENPDEPNKGQDVKVDPKETNIQVTATILKWNLVNRNVVLK